MPGRNTGIFDKKIPLSACKLSNLFSSYFYITGKTIERDSTISQVSIHRLLRILIRKKKKINIIVKDHLLVHTNTFNKPNQ